MTAATKHGYVRIDELQCAMANNRLPQVFEDTGLRLLDGLSSSFTLFGVNAAEVSRCGEGARLPDELRQALEAHWTRQIQHRGPPVTYAITISRNRVTEQGVGVGNWVGLRNRHGRAVHLGQALGIITDVEWKQPHLKLLGLDLDRKVAIYEYAGEIRRS